MTTPRPGDFALVDIPDFTGKLIRLGQWLNGSGFAAYDHVALYLGDGLIAEEAPKAGARVARLDSYPPENLYWSSAIIGLSDAERSAIVHSAIGYVAKHAGYSFADYLAIAAHRLRLPAPYLRSYIRSSGHMICSQFIDQCYYEAGVSLFNDQRWQGYVTPGDLFKLLKSHAAKAG